MEQVIMDIRGRITLAKPKDVLARVSSMDVSFLNATRKLIVNTEMNTKEKRSCGCAIPTINFVTSLKIVYEGH